MYAHAKQVRTRKQVCRHQHVSQTQRREHTPSKTGVVVYLNILYLYVNIIAVQTLSRKYFRKKMYIHKEEKRLDKHIPTKAEVINCSNASLVCKRLSL